MTLGDRVAAVLDTARIAHALIGATALAAAGVARSTFDLDFLTTSMQALDAAVWHGLRDAGVDVEIRRGDVDDPLAGVVRVSASGERPVDLIVGRFEWQRRAVERARLLSTGARVVLPRDLVLLKLYAGGTQDVWDVRQLLNALTDVPLASEVEADLSDLPPAARELWIGIQGGT